MTPDAADTLDELAAFGEAAEPATPSFTLTDLVERHPLPAALAAAAAGAALTAWLSLMTQTRELEPADVARRPNRDSPLWTALAVGAVGALLGSQLLGAPASPAALEPQSDPGADA